MPTLPTRFIIRLSGPDRADKIQLWQGILQLHHVLCDGTHLKNPTEKGEEDLFSGKKGKNVVSVSLNSRSTYAETANEDSTFGTRVPW